MQHIALAAALGLTEIAVRRRKLAALQQKEGQASARDVLEAEQALLEAQNA
jgi:hypothetical protein